MITALRETGRLRILLAAVACGCLAVWALSQAYADLAMSRPRAALAAWQSGEPVGDYRARRRLLERMGRAVAVNPLDADQRMDLGRFFAWHAARHAPGSPRHRLYAGLAADRFQEAVTARPTWGYAWMLMAEQWAGLGVDEREVIAAMGRGALLAPREPGVQLKYLWLGLGRWERLDADQRKRLLDGLALLLDSREYFRDAAGIALQHGRQDLVAQAVEAPWQQQAYARMTAGRGG